MTLDLNAKPRKFYSIMFLGICCFCFLQYIRYMRIPVPLAEKAMPPIKPSNDTDMIWKSHFIYKAPTDSKLVSLTYNCPSCKLPCSPVNETISPTCKGKMCLCNKLSPVITFPTYKDNSAFSKNFMLQEEKESLDTKHITDLKALPSIIKSKARLVYNKNSYQLGDKIHIIMNLVNGYGNELLRGGDDIRVVMKEKSTQTSIAGTVNDLKNGTYFITIPVLWEGKNTISISVNYFQEERATVFRWYRQFGTLFYHYGLFTRNRVEQWTLCTVYPHIEGYNETCNMTLYNDGFPWFCGKPPSNKLGCDDIVKSYDFRFVDIPVTKAEEVLFRRVCSYRDRKLPQIQVKVKGGNYSRDHLPQCTGIKPTETWKTDEPSGYFLQNRYYSTQCRSLPPNITHCLQNTLLILHGDSTVLQWIRYLKKYSGCVLNKNYTSGKWYQEMVCEKKKWGFSMKFAPHNMPFSSFETRHHRVAPATKSMQTILNEIPSTGRTIFVIHHGAHYTRQHYNVFREKLIQLKPALKNALNRNKQLTVLIKGPHMFTCVHWVPSVNESLIPHLINIIFEVLKEFSDRVFYLNYYDMSVAAENKHVHADAPFIKQMIETMLTYTCK